MMLFRAFNNGLSVQEMPADYVAQAGEFLFNHFPNPGELAASFPAFGAAAAKQQTNANLISQIVILEQGVTERRIREAILGVDGGWLANVNAQIVTLRSQLLNGGNAAVSIGL